jgi:hypothetical protein
MKRLLFCLCVLSACGGGGGFPADTDMSSANQDGGFGSDLALECANVTVTPNDGVVPATLTAVATGGGAGVPVWTVTKPDGTTATPMPLDASGARVSIVADMPGTYDFQVTFSDSSSIPCQGDNSVQVAAPQAEHASYRIRLTPPASSGLPQQDSVLNVYGMTPQSDADWFLVAGTALGGVLSGPSGNIGGEVQLFPQMGPELTVAVGASGSFSLPISIDATYQLVLIPSDPTLAPKLLGPVDGATLLGQSFTVDTGVVVTGLVRDPLAQPLAAASVALRADVLPSGLGTSASDGSYTLHAEPGSYTLAAAVAGWPDVSLSGVSIGAGGAAINIAQALGQQTVSFTVVHADGTTAVVGAQLALRSRSIAGAANVSINGVSQPAAGVMRAQGTSGSGGVYATLMPPATYDVMLTPPAGASEGVTGLAVVVSGSTVTLALAPQRTLMGVVNDSTGTGVGAATISVLSADGSLLRSTSSDASGVFSVALDAGVPVDLQIDPPGAALLSSVRVHLGATDGTLGGVLPSTVTVTLPVGLPISGFVRGPSGAPLAGVTVDLLCLSCGDETVLAHAASNSVGMYRLAVPDPGMIEVDAGADGP